MVSATVPSRPGLALRKLTLTETKMLGRTPAVARMGCGLFPASNKRVAGFGGLSVLQTWLPVIILFSLVMSAVNFLPATLVSYRERGVLRRMSTTPVRPRTLLTAQLLLNLGVQIATLAV